MTAAPPSPRRGWTTGACAAAAARAAFIARATGTFPDPVRLTLPRGVTACLPLSRRTLDGDAATAGVIKDSGDEAADVTNGLEIQATITAGTTGAGVVFRAGPGVGTVVGPGLPLPPGEPAINPGPRRIIAATLAGAAAEMGASADVVVTIAIPGGAEVAARTMNPRLGILGGLSVLGTTGVLVPYSREAWVRSLHTQVDVARARGRHTLVAVTGRTSEDAARRLFDPPAEALLDMGDHADALVRYLRARPVARLVVVAGFAKACKLARGRTRLHSADGTLAPDDLARLLTEAGADPAVLAAAAGLPTAAAVLDLARARGVPLAATVARRAAATLRGVLGAATAAGVVVVDRDGAPVGRWDA